MESTVTVDLGAGSWSSGPLIGELDPEKVSGIPD